MDYILGIKIQSDGKGASAELSKVSSDIERIGKTADVTSAKLRAAGESTSHLAKNLSVVSNSGSRLKNVESGVTGIGNAGRTAMGYLQGMGRGLSEVIASSAGLERVGNMVGTVANAVAASKAAAAGAGAAAAQAGSSLASLGVAAAAGYTAASRGVAQMSKELNTFRSGAAITEKTLLELREKLKATMQAGPGGTASYDMKAALDVKRAEDFLRTQQTFAAQEAAARQQSILAMANAQRDAKAYMEQRMEMRRAMIQRELQLTIQAANAARDAEVKAGLEGLKGTTVYRQAKRQMIREELQQTDLARLSRTHNLK